MHLKNIQQPEAYQRIGAGFVFLACVYFYYYLHFNFLWFVIFLFSVDIFMLGYLLNPKIGAHIYNLGHSTIIPAILLVFGTAYTNNYLLAAGIIWLAHVGWDRAFGYGLKFRDGFKHTHLGDL
jgi:hypothetical protein